MISTIRLGNKAISSLYNEKYHVIGFENITIARHVQYNLLHNNPIIYTNVKKHNNVERPLHTNVELIMQKSTINTDILNNPFHLETHSRKDFLCYPINKMIGIIIVDTIDEECDKLIHMNGFLIEPLFIPNVFASNLKP